MSELGGCVKDSSRAHDRPGRRDQHTPHHLGGELEAAGTERAHEQLDVLVAELLALAIGLLAGVLPARRDELLDTARQLPSWLPGWLAEPVPGAWLAPLA